MVGLLFRLTGLNWDQNFHLHPDERFLTMVGTAMQMPVSFEQYLNPSTSLFNPANIGFIFYVYGIFPLVLNKILAVVFGNDSYNSFTLQGRALSAMFDSLSIIFVYLLARHFELKHHWYKGLKYIAALFYAVSVLPIQLSHFFTVDPFLNFFSLASAYFALHKRTIILSSIALGLAVASKVTAVFTIPLIGFFLLSNVGDKKKYLLQLFFYVLVAYFTVRLANPYMFETENVFNATLSSHFLQNIEQLRALDNPKAFFPPGVQWIPTKPVWYSLSNLAMFGLGIPYFLFLVVGYFVIFRKNLKSIVGALALWSMVFFISQSFQFSKPMRYMNLLYPYFAVIAGLGFIWVSQRVSRGAARILLLFVFLWPLSFMVIYLRPHSRVTASEWVYQNVPANSIILSEHWDDSLPLQLHETRYDIRELPIFAQDTPDKIATVEAMMRSADYYILSSNRGWGSIGKAPEVYPYMSRLYERLFDNRTDYRLVRKFSSYPFGISDKFADESFTVYDHPVVLIYKNIKSLGK